MARFTEREIQFAASRWKDLDAEISEWDECRLYLPSSVSKNIVTQISGANKLLAALELYMIRSGGMSPGLVDERCLAMARITNLATNSRASCEKCVRRGEKTVEEYSSRPDPDC